jgi:hypothetical protein
MTSSTRIAMAANLLGWVASGVLAVDSPARGQNLRALVRSSRWDTTYTTPDGARQRAIVTIEGDSGHYEAIDNAGNVIATGELGQVRVDVNPQTQKFFMSGVWRFENGQGGGFAFTGDSEKFRGEYGFGNNLSGVGTWNGRRMAGQGGGGPVQGPNIGQGQVNYGPWRFNNDTGYYFRVCTFPAGGYQYLILYPSKPQWVYWFNPNGPNGPVFWCACPTVRHPQFGNAISQGQDLFLMATTKGRTIEQTSFPDDAGPNFKTGAQAKDRDGSAVNLNCPPPDLPSDLP